MTMPSWIDLALYVASGLVFAAFFMRAIVPLRSVAIASNIAFVLYGLGAWNVPILALHLALLPLNLVRIHQHLALSSQIRQAMEHDPQVERLVPLMERRQLADGTVIFNKGDPADEMYVLVNGTVRFPEVDVTLQRGAIFGEISMFLHEGGRTASAVCVGECEVCALSQDRVMELVMRDPGFGLFLTRLITMRLHENALASRSTPD